MTNEITEEQDAVKIAEWLGWEDTHKQNIWFLPDHNIKTAHDLEKYLSSPEGEVAMMDRLGGMELKLCISPATIHCDFHEVFINARDFRFSEETWVGSGVRKTRNAALQLAILAMLEKEKNDHRK